MRKSQIASWLRTRNGKIAGVFTAVALGLTTYDFWPENNGPTVPVSQFMNAVREGRLSEVTMRGDMIIARRKDNGDIFNTNGVYGQGAKMVSEIGAIDKNLSVKAEPPPKGPVLKRVWDEISTPLIGASIFLPVVILAMVLGQKLMQGGMGKNKKKFSTEYPKENLGSVIGQDEAKASMQDIVDFLKDPQKFKKMGSIIPRGTLLVGPPGTGKTLLAKSLAGAAKVPFLSVSGSDFVEMFVGLGAARVRNMFEHAKKLGPCIIFIDEIDAVGRARSSSSHPGSQEQEQTLNQMLVEMDGFDNSSGVIVIAATNRPEMLDAALLRPGRFTRHEYVDLPNEEDREKILAFYIEKKKLETKRPDLFDDTIDLKALSRLTRGGSGADLANIINEATLYCSRYGLSRIGQEILLKTYDKIVLGPEKKDKSHSEALKERVKRHEAGHAIVGHFMHLKYGTSRPEKATVIPRAKSLGHVLTLAEEGLQTINQLKANMAMYAAGRAAEEIFYGGFENVSVGASGDMEQMTAVAHVMVMQHGMVLDDRNEMDEGIGMVNYTRLFSLGSGSGETNEKLIASVRKLCNDAYREAKQTISDNKEAWLRLGDALHEYETLGAEEIAHVINGKAIRAEQPAAGTAELAAKAPQLLVA
ncbi:MAG: hflB [Micavibrio sp.]|nr:hflB [Micavibrio sp.]